MLIVACLCDMTMNFWCEKGEGAWVRETPLALLWDWSCVGRDMQHGFVESKFFPGEKYLIGGYSRSGLPLSCPGTGPVSRHPQCKSTRGP